MAAGERRLYFTGQPDTPRPAAPIALPPPLIDRLRDPAGYVADPGVVDAVHVAITLGQPILVTGEPGTGKTQLAYALAHELGLGRPLECLVKSTSTAADFFYGIDDLARFRDSQDPKRRDLPLRRYLAFHGLGKAILFAGGPTALLEPLPGRPHLETPPDRFADLLPQEEFPHEDGLPVQRRSVVLIDELDKAPRDVPNDILTEIDAMRFDVVELGVRVQAPETMRPIVVVTSNAEKSLPDPFLRRCAYYHIPFPEPRTLARIVDHRVEQLEGGGPLVEDAIGLFALLRSRDANLAKPPATAELLGWLLLLVHDAGLGPGDRVRGRHDLLERYLSTLIKNEDDRPRARHLLAAQG